ncbi:MAG: M48 family metallopeptidase [Methylotenera sp.]|nr:M48 family metallopeptidase [Oligoflexia bacterium]
MKNHEDQTGEFSSQEASASRGLIWLVVACALVFGVYESLPRVARKIPWSLERKAFEHLPLFSARQECSASAESTALLQKVIARIHPLEASDREYPIHVTVIQGKEVNAFTFLAGQVFVYDGLLQQAESPEELAGVLAHEFEHVRRRHVTEGLIQRVLLTSLSQVMLPSSASGGIPGLLDAAVRLKFSRGQEEQADRGALERLKKGQVNVAGFRRFFSRKTGSPEFLSLLSDHPSDDSRLKLADSCLGSPSTPILSEAEWESLKGICATPPAE